MLSELVGCAVEIKTNCALSVRNCAFGRCQRAALYYFCRERQAIFCRVRTNRDGTSKNLPPRRWFEELCSACGASRFRVARCAELRQGFKNFERITDVVEGSGDLHALYEVAHFEERLARDL